MESGEGEKAEIVLLKAAEFIPLISLVRGSHEHRVEKVCVGAVVLNVV